MKRTQGAGTVTPALRRPFKIPALKPPGTASAPLQQAIAAPTPSPSRSAAPAAAASSSEEAGEPSGLQAEALPAAAPTAAEAAAAAGRARPKLPKLPGLRRKAAAASAGSEAPVQAQLPAAVVAGGQGGREEQAAAACMAAEPAEAPSRASNAAASQPEAAEGAGGSRQQDPAPAPTTDPAAAAAGQAAPAGTAPPGGKAAGWVVKRLPVDPPESMPQPAAPAAMPPAAQLLGHLPALPMSSAALLPLDHPALGDLAAVAADIEAAVLPQPMETAVGGSSTAVAAASSCQALSAVARTVTAPQTAPPARPCPSHCCNGRFEDTALLTQAADAAEDLGSDALRMACRRNAAVRAEALRLATDLLPAALMLNMDLFMHERPEVPHEDTPLPQPLDFTLLQAEYNLCEALQGQLSTAERNRLLRALVPLVHGVLDTSGYGYGFEYLVSIGHHSTTWEEIGGNYAIFFFDSEVEDEGVLQLVRQHDLQMFFEAWADAASEAGGGLPTAWLHVAYLRALEHGALSVGACMAPPEVKSVLLSNLKPAPVARDGTLLLGAEGSEEERAQRALAALVTGFELNSLHPQSLAQLAPELARAGCNVPGRQLLAAAVRTIWPLSAGATAQLKARGWVPAAPDAVSGPAAGSDSHASPTALARALGALLQRHRPDVSLADLHHSCLVALTIARRLKLEMEDNTSAAWQAELKQGLAEVQLLLDLSPAEPHHYLAASHYLEHSEFLDAAGLVGALRLTQRGAEVAKQSKGWHAAMRLNYMAIMRLHSMARFASSDIVAQPMAQMEELAREMKGFEKKLQVQQRRKKAEAVVAEFRSTGRLRAGEFGERLNVDQRRLLCAQCSQPAMHLKKCAACKQVKHWKEGGHKAECAGLAAVVAQRKGR
ncbi:hypothetical protein C2E21_2715 [Chlorella sorokiniana]|uniref:Uncharacterized protein n=1 Tax=Chlorella sorokiniana TaxID=3076 RepID=A0A2P6TWI6_CHLSO|nr:hypothetical protein C2E21_2715 [Chlorella sorokiniana]|eukprot:PRW58422.1 hypothetical protein C2E21_2715 [Chlorella sorokiniana]